jgi:hypothetical protein
MKAWGDEILRILRNNDSYTAELPTLEWSDTKPTAEEALEAALDKVAGLSDVIGGKVAEIDSRLEVIERERKALLDQKAELKKQVTGEREVVRELLEEKSMCKQVFRLFADDHWMSEAFGKGKGAKCIAFRPWKDMDGDGDIDYRPTMYW